MYHLPFLLFMNLLILCHCLCFFSFLTADYREITKICLYIPSSDCTFSLNITQPCPVASVLCKWFSDAFSVNSFIPNKSVICSLFILQKTKEHVPIIYILSILYILFIYLIYFINIKRKRTHLYFVGNAPSLSIQIINFQVIFS